MIWQLTLLDAQGNIETFETTDDHPWHVNEGNVEKSQLVEGHDGAAGNRGNFLRTDELAAGMEISTQDGDGVSVIEVIKTTDRANGPDAPIGGASAFSSRLAAEELVGTVLANRSTDIKNYLSRSRGPNSKRVLDFETGQATGRWTPNGGSATQSVSGVRVVIKPDAFVPSGYRVITAHPIPSSQIKPNN